MFEHFGLKDIFCGLWKFKYWILLGTVLLGIIGGFVFSSDIVDEGHEEYYYSQTWYFNQEEMKQDTDAEKEEGENYAQIINGLIDADISRQFIKEKVLESYTEEEVLEILDKKDNPDGLTWSILTHSVNHFVVDGGNTISLALKVPDEELGQVLTDAYDSLVKHLGSQMKDADKLKIVNMGQAEEIYNVTTTGIGTGKAAVLGAMLGFVLSCIVVFFICLWVPTINRKSDFDEYGLVVLGKIKEV